MRRLLRLLALCFAGLGLGAEAEGMRGVLIDPGDVTAAEIAKWKGKGITSGILLLREGSVLFHAARQIQNEGLALQYWIEVGRNPALANAHPEWLASIQGHPEWRRSFKTFPQEKTNEVVKTYPWVPIHYKESFAAHLERIEKLLRNLPQAETVFLNDLQGAPSACGCGHGLCRWTTDYGPKLTATPRKGEVAADFIRAVGKLAPSSKVVPVWATECEEEDKDTVCGGVGCYAGTCWKVWSAQVKSLTEVADQMGVLTTYKALDRDLPRYGQTAGWVEQAIRSFSEMPPKRGGEAIPARRLIPVLQGWDVSATELQAQILRAKEAGAVNYIIARSRIVQDWSPKLVQVPVKP